MSEACETARARPRVSRRMKKAGALGGTGLGTFVAGVLAEPIANLIIFAVERSKKESSKKVPKELTLVTNNVVANSSTDANRTEEIKVMVTTVNDTETENATIFTVDDPFLQMICDVCIGVTIRMYQELPKRKTICTLTLRRNARNFQSVCNSIARA